jgi:LAO/AO transport system kinase
MPSKDCATLESAMAEHPLLQPLLRGDRRALGRAITLVESRRAADRAEIQLLLAQLPPRSQRTLRLGISGPPGAGKSTFIEALGLTAIAAGRRVAVLAVDPSSSISGGSILGDKTRMERLSMHEVAFIRPTPAGSALGGVAEGTRETIRLCEAAGYDLILVETVGVGQSETAVSRMTDLFLLLQLPNTGDDLQAIKRGVMELASIVVVNKADLDPDAARRSARQLEAGLGARGAPFVVGALTGEGIAALWQDIAARNEVLRAGNAEHLASAERRAAGTSSATGQQQPPEATRPFTILGIQQVAIGAEDKQRLRRLWVDLLGLPLTGQFTSAHENVDEDICTLGEGAHRVQVDLMQPLDPQARPTVQAPALHHLGLWVDDLPRAIQWLMARGLRFAPGGIRKGADGHDVCFIHPHAGGDFPLGGEGVLIELVQAPEDVITVLTRRNRY